MAMDGVGGVTEMVARVGALAVIVSMAVPLLPLMAAVIVTDPAATPVATPGCAWPEVWMVASAVFEEVQVAELVRFFVEPSL